MEPTPRPALLIVDLQPTFTPPPSLVRSVSLFLGRLPTVASVERHDEARVPFRKQLGWAPAADDDCLVRADKVFFKHGYLQPPALIDHLRALQVGRVYVCGIQGETCVLAAGFALFDAGLSPTLLADLVVSSSLDPSGDLGTRLWRHHFGAVSDSEQLTRLLDAGATR